MFDATFCYAACALSLATLFWRRVRLQGQALTELERRCVTQRRRPRAG